MVLEDIEKAKNKIYKQKNHNKKYIDDYFSKIYHMSTENLSGYLRGFEFSEKSVLTTGSSCDQVLNLINYGCFNIEHFDINPFVRYYYALKKAAILELNSREYLKFFNYDRNISGCKTLNERTYFKLSKILDGDSKLFWDSLYSLFTPNEISERLFFNELMSKENVVLNNDYLSSTNYRLLRKKLEKVNVNFMNININDLPLLNKKYDYVLLSNIFDYLYKLNVLLDDDELTDSLICYCLFLKRLVNLLTDDGIMFFHYLWEREHNYLFYKVKNFISDDEHIFNIDFPNCNGKDYHDTVMVYSKKIIKKDVNSF